MNIERANETRELTSLRASLKVKLEAIEKFLEWRGKLDEAIVSSPGFISMEVIPPVPLSGDPWIIIQRFRSFADLDSWEKSDLHNSLKLEVLPYLVDGPLGLREQKIKDHASNDFATEVFVTRVNPKKNQAFRIWEAKIQKAESKFEGYQGVYIQAPANVYEHGNWITMLRFDTAENLNRWLKSDERREILKEGEPLFEKLESHQVISPFAGWFGGLAKRGNAPAIWKEAMLVLLVLYPIVMLEIKFLMPHIGGAGVVLATFIGNMISVSFVSWPMMPIAIYFLGWWLQPDPTHKTRINIIGALIVILLYILEILIFNYFFFGGQIL